MLVVYDNTSSHFSRDNPFLIPTKIILTLRSGAPIGDSGLWRRFWQQKDPTPTIIILPDAVLYRLNIEMVASYSCMAERVT